MYTIRVTMTSMLVLPFWTLRNLYLIWMYGLDSYSLLCLYMVETIRDLIWSNMQIQRRLAQNREAARKSRLRKKV